MTILTERPVTHSIPILIHGEQMDQSTFHERYEAMPPGTRAELIGGTVYIMPSPVSLEHSKPHSAVMWWLSHYEVETPGIEVMDNATLLMNFKSEPQPDASIRVLPSHGGRTSIRQIKKKSYVKGAPELVVEVSSSTATFDLNQKKTDYERAGVDEYVVVLTEKNAVVWYYQVEGRYEDLQPGGDSIYRSIRFPGLWLDAAALLRADKRRLREVVEHGLAFTRTVTQEG